MLATNKTPVQEEYQESCHTEFQLPFNYHSNEVEAILANC